MKRIIFIVFAVLNSVWAMQTDAFARAGGGDAVGVVLSSGTIIIAILLSPVILSMIIYYYIRSKMKKAEAQKLMQKLASTDRTWNQGLLEKRAREVYFAVQKAWTKNDIELCRAYVSDRLFDHHQDMLTQMAMKGEKNILKQIQLDECTVLAAHDYKGEDDDEAYIKIVGSLVDYTVDRSGKILRGDNVKPTAFEELWVFAKHSEYGWVLDEIRKAVDFYQISDLKSFSEENGTK